MISEGVISSPGEALGTVLEMMKGSGRFIRIQRYNTVINPDTPLFERGTLVYGGLYT
jgi:hypothetical protein